MRQRGRAGGEGGGWRGDTGAVGEGAGEGGRRGNTTSKFNNRDGNEAPEVLICWMKT